MTANGRSNMRPADVISRGLRPGRATCRDGRRDLGVEFGQHLWDIFWWTLWVFCFVAFFFLLWHVFGDLFSDPALGGWGKFWWSIFIIFLPFLGLLVYVIARGKGMAERQVARMSAQQAQTDAYIRGVAGSAASPADQIASAKALLDSGAVTQAEFDALKAKAIAG